MREYLTPDFLKFFLPLVGAVLAWFLNERRRRAWEEYLRKDERYRELLRTLTGFYTFASDSDIRRQFLEEYKRCWLYCSDEVIKAANLAMEGMIENSALPNDERLQRIGSLVIAIRRDLLRRTLTQGTALSPEDYVHIAPGK